MAQTQASPNILIVPSPLIRAETYFGLKEHLQKFGHVGILELPETGNYGSMKKVWFPEDYARWVSSFIVERQFENLILIGHSNSGPIVTKVAHLIPDRIQSLVLADSIGAGNQKPMKVLRGRLIDAFLEFRFSMKAFPHLLKNAVAHPRNFFFQVGLSHKEQKEVLFHEKRHHPIFLAWGERDHTMPVDMAHQIQKHYPHAQTYISKSGSHDWILTNPDEFLKALAPWIVEFLPQHRKVEVALTNFENAETYWNPTVSPPPS